MKAILEFELPEDSVDFELSSKGTELFYAVWELINNDLRSKAKYSEDKNFTCDEADKFRMYLIKYFRDNNLWDVINSIP